MTELRLYHVRQSDDYENYYAALVRAESAEEARERHIEWWRDEYDRADDDEPRCEVCATVVAEDELVRGEVVLL